VAHTHRLAGLPLGDRHAVGEADRADLGVAHERGADAAVLIGVEPDGDGVGHPLDVVLDLFDRLPDARWLGVDLDGDVDRSHGRGQALTD
jgi:hypothetical protein